MEMETHKVHGCVENLMVEVALNIFPGPKHAERAAAFRLQGYSTDGE